MERHQRIQLKTTSRSTNQPVSVSSFQTRGFGVQQKAASTPASKAELWENYQRSSHMTQQGAGQTRSAIQTKLTIGQPGDKYEQEADSVADRVMAMSEPAQVQREELGEEEELQMKPLAGMISPLVQREELPEEEEELQMKPEDHLVQREELPEEEEELQMKSLDNSIQREELPEEEEEIQMKEAATSSTPAATTSLEERLSSSKGGGSLLSDDVRSFMEPRFGADFSGVRVHTGSDAVQMNQDVNAQAFAHGQDVYFGAGKAPGKDALTAHELTHVVQQTGEVQRQITKTPQPKSVAISSVTKSEETFIHRDTPDTSNSQPSANTKYYFDIDEEKIGEKKLSYGKVSSSIKAKGSIELMQVNNGGQGIEAPVTQGVSKTLKGAGYKTERVLGKQHVSESIRDWTFDGDFKEKFITEIGTEKVDISIGFEARAKCLKIPELKAAGDIKAIIAATSLKEVNKTKVLALEGGLGLEGEGTIELPNIGLAKIKTTGQIVGTLEPNWEKIIAKATEIALRKGAELLAMDSGAVASTAAGIAFPLGATALMIAGGMQTEKNISASRAAIAMGVKMRSEAKNYAHVYVNTLTGGNGSGQGFIDANVKVMEYMTATGKNREDACVDFSEKNGGSGSMYNEIITAFREQVFEKSVAEFEQKFADQFGVIESLGSEWGMRGVFRKDFRRLLYDTW